MAKRANGEGSIYQDIDGRWRGVLSVPRVQGKRCRVKVSGKTRKEVVAKLDDLRRRLGQGQDVSSRLTVGQFMESWLPVYARSVSEATTRISDSLYRTHFGPIKDVRIDRLNASQIDHWLTGIADKPRSPNTVRLCRNLLHRMLQQAMRQNVVFRNECALSMPPRIIQREPQHLDREQVRALLVAAEDERWGMGILLLAAFGLRRGSMLALVWRDVDWERGTLSVRVAKTAASRRSYTLSAPVLVALRRHREREESLARIRGRIIGLDSPIVSTSAGTFVDGRNFYKFMVRLGLTVGIQGCNPHRLRHSLAVLMFNDGVELKTVSDLLGHSSIRLTGDIYAASLPATRSDALDRYAETIAPGLLPEADDEVGGDVPAGL